MSAMSTAASVVERYDELATLVASIDGRPVADPSAAAVAAPLLAREARLLDANRHDEWLEWFDDDAVVWVPLRPGAHPGRDQSLFLDDRRRLHERVAWRQDPSAWGQQPASGCVRAVGAVEAWDASGGTIVAHSTIVISELRHGRAQLLVGRQIHELVADRSGRRCRTKVLLVPALGEGVRNPSFLL